MLTRPAKSLSARNFFKKQVKDQKSQRDKKHFTTLHTEPVETPAKRLATTTRLDSQRLHKHPPTMKIRESSIVIPEELREQNMRLK